MRLTGRIGRISSAATELDLHLDRLTYRPLSELGADEKATRDAGSIAVAEL